MMNESETVSDRRFRMRTRIILILTRCQLLNNIGGGEWPPSNSITRKS